MSEPMDNAARQRLSRKRRKEVAEYRRSQGEVKVEVWLDAEAVALVAKAAKAEGISAREKCQHMAQFFANNGIKTMMSIMSY